MTTFVFPGQGSQYLGMAKDFNDNFEVAKLAFEEIENYSGIDIRKIIFQNEDDKLNKLLSQFSELKLLFNSSI